MKIAQQIMLTTRKTNLTATKTGSTAQHDRAQHDVAQLDTVQHAKTQHVVAGAQLDMPHIRLHPPHGHMLLTTTGGQHWRSVAKHGQLGEQRRFQPHLPEHLQVICGRIVA